MKTKSLLLWTFLQMIAICTFAQPNERSSSSLQILKAETLESRIAQEQIHELQKQALHFKFSTAAPLKVKRAANSTALKLYGYLEFDEKLTDKGIVTFTSDNLQAMEYLYKTNAFTISAGAYANDRYYYYAYMVYDGHILPLGFYEMDLESGATNMIKDYSSMSMLYGDMTYDYMTNTMWTYSETDNGPVLLSVDLKTGNYETIASLKNALITIAADGNGDLYGITKAGSLCTINKVSGEMSDVGSTGISPAYLQSMEFDRSNNVLYWAASTSSNEGFLATVDTQTGKATKLGTLGNNSQVLGLYVPHTSSIQKAPKAPTELAITTFEDENKASLAWQNPDKDVSDNNLNKLINAKIYRNGSVIATVENPPVGKQSIFEDTNAPTGLLTYSITVSNEIGESPMVTSKKYIGRDLPAAPNSLSIQKMTQNSVTLSWKAPTTGQNEGWIDASTLTYKVIRYPDAVVLTESTDKNSIEDLNITEYNNYYYTVQAINADGAGDAAISQHVSLGAPFTTPYSCPFVDEKEFNRWTVIDNNKDGITWTYYYHSAQYKFSSIAPGDDWLISPPISLKKDATYKISFGVVTGGMPEKLRITLGKEATIAGQTIVLDDSQNSSTEKITKSVYLPEITEDGIYHVALYNHSDAYQFYINIDNFILEESHVGKIKGTVSDQGNPVKDCEVMIKETGAKGISDEFGNYVITNVEAGNYTLVFSGIGYVAQEKQVSVTESSTIQLDCDLVQLPKHTVTGTVMNTANAPLENINIFLKGYADFDSKTGKDGKFILSDVYEADSYTLKTENDFYYPTSQSFNLKSDKDLGTINLTEKVLPPYMVKSVEQNKAQLISWSNPVDTVDFKYDDGNVSGQLSIGYQYDGGNLRSLCGVIYHTPALLNSISWYLTPNEAIKDKVTIYVFDLNEEGEVTNRILYTKTDVPVLTGQWSTLNFEKEVYAPNGYMAAVGVDDGYVTIGLDSSTEDTFAEQAQCLTEDYQDGIAYLTTYDTAGRNLMLRTNGTPTTEVTSAVEKQLPNPYSYKIWRLENGKEREESSWTLISSTSLSGNELRDQTWGNIPQGVYRYAVKSVSKDGNNSVPAFSAKLYKDVFTSANIKINTNTVGNTSKGAIVTLYNDKNSYTDTIRTTENEIQFNNVWKGIYSLKAVLPGYSTLIKDNLDLSKESSYEFSDCTLLEIIEKPFNLSIEDTANKGECLLKWDKGLFDNFELHSNFTINSPGNIGWTYIDGDQSLTHGSAIFSFPGMGEKMAYIVMNYKETAPNDTVAYSGKKYLAAFTAQSGHNDDYIISPELKADKDFKMSFYARTYEASFGLETFRVGYSTKGNQDPEDFEWIEGSKQNPSLAWTFYEFTVPATAKYVTINCISMGTYILMLDDIFIDADMAEKTHRDFYSYEVYLDNQFITKTEEHSYLLTNLKNGDHKASVRRIYSSGESDFTDLNFTIKDDGTGIQNTENEISIYPNPATDYLYIKGDYATVQLIDNMGKVVIDRDHSENFIQVHSLPAGLYLVKVTSADHKVTLQKIFVKK